MKVGIIGGGSIGGSFSKTLIDQKIVLPEHLLLVERNEKTCEELRHTLGCYVSTSFYPTLSEVDVLILAVKPQDFSDVAVKLSELLRSHQIVLSMMTGIKIERLQRELEGHTKIVRNVPNLPFIVGQGLSVCFTSEELTEADKQSVNTVLVASGELLFVSSEDLLDAATALSASGTGYIAHLLHYYEEASKKLGFTSAESKLIVGQTLLGTAALYLGSDGMALDIQKKVATKGGTTEAAINELKEHTVGETLINAIEKAYQRAQQLGKS